MESTLSIECCTFDGTKSNYLFDPVNQWSVLEALESRLEIKEERQTSWHFPTLTILWTRDQSRRESFSVFFPESHRQLRSYFYFLVFFLTLRARGMRRWWRRRRTRRSPPSLLTSLLSSSRWRTRLGRRGCPTSFLCLLFLERFAPFWARISLDNSLLYFWAMRAILLIILIAFSHCTFLRLTSAILYLRSVKASKIERGKWGSRLHFYIAMTLGIQHSIKTDIL